MKVRVSFCSSGYLVSVCSGVNGLRVLLFVVLCFFGGNDLGSISRLYRKFKVVSLVVNRNGVCSLCLFS